MTKIGIISEPHITIGLTGESIPTEPFAKQVCPLLTTLPVQAGGSLGAIPTPGENQTVPTQLPDGNCTLEKVAFGSPSGSQADFTVSTGLPDDGARYNIYYWKLGNAGAPDAQLLNQNISGAGAQLLNQTVPAGIAINFIVVAAAGSSVNKFVNPLWVLKVEMIL